MARNEEDMLRWGDIKDALIQYHAEQEMSKYVTEREFEIARSSIEGALYAVEDVPSADVVENMSSEILDAIEKGVAEATKKVQKHPVLQTVGLQKLLIETGEMYGGCIGMSILEVISKYMDGQI